MNLIEMLARGLIVFVVLFVLCRLMGKKQLSQLTYFNYIAGIAIGSISANIIFNTSSPFFNGVIVLVFWSALAMLLGFASLKSKEASKLLTGQPTIIVKNGELLKDSFLKCRLNMTEFTTLMREQKVFSVSDIDYAFLETNGKLTIYKKEQKQYATKGDINAPMHGYQYFSCEIINNGNINKENLTEFHLDEEWLRSQLLLSNIHSAQEVLYAELQMDGTLTIYKK